MFPFGDTVTRHRGQKVDDGYGGSVIDWSQPTTDITLTVGLAPRTGEELDGAGRAGVIIGYTMYAEHGVDVTFEDRFTTPYGLFEVDGEPGTWKNPLTGWEAGVTLPLRRVVG